MYYGKLLYSARGGAVRLKDERYETGDPSVTSIRLWSDDESIFLEFCVTIESMDKYAELEKKVEKICNEFQVKIAFKFDSEIELFRCVGGSVDSEQNVVVVVPCLELAVRQLPPVILCDEESGILQEMVEDDGRIFKYQEMYVVALRKIGLDERYMYLYNILLALTGDKSQSCVEKIILKFDPYIAMFKVKMSGKVKTTQETLYTKLRNEICHHREGAFVRTTGKEVEGCIERFQALVKKAIKDFG